MAYTIDDVSHIRLHWSELSYLNRKYRKNDGCDIERDVPVDDSHWDIMMCANGDGGYDKTKMTIVFKDGGKYQGRMDVNSSEQSLRRWIIERIGIFNEYIAKAE